MREQTPSIAWDAGPTFPHWSEQLRGNRSVLIRPVCASDADAERVFIEALTPEARRFRFMGQINHPSADLVRSLTELDPAHAVAFAAVDASNQQTFVGVSRYSSSADGSECECAVSVLQDWQQRGLGTTLMKHLIDVARSRGIHYMWSLDAADNVRMAELARPLGFTRRADPGDASQVIHELRF